ncbi:glutathione synthase [Malassezia sp. CBS 17886]|nr:glutathione synthase [Malassezia sp. CBS 17886]
MSVAAILPEWPPHEMLDATRVESMSSDARDYALGHGLVYRMVPAPGELPPSDAVVHAPMSLMPTPFPRTLYDQGVELQPLYNKLYARVAMDDAFLADVLEGSVAKVDEFQRRLYEIWQTVRAEGISQPFQLGLFRSDYLMHMADDGALALKQVEFNTISSSFGALCSVASDMHNYLLAKGAYEASHPRLNAENLPENQALHTLVQGLADAHHHYISTRPGAGRSVNPTVLFVVQPGERNSFDQRALETALVKAHGIRVVRQTLEELHESASLHGAERVLVLQAPLLGNLPVEVSTVYFRSGYAPADYPSPAAWDARLLLERSHAIKSPTVALQLAGAKKVQQVLTEPGVLERFLGCDADIVRLSFTELWPLDDSPAGREALAKVRADPGRYVIKPQREGGSNNIYRHDILGALDDMEARDAAKADGDVKEREAYVLMSLIETPPHRGNLLLRSGGPRSATLVQDTVSELGVYGAVLFRRADTDAEGGDDIASSHSSGFLLRTKASDSNEGGVAVGYSVIDTPLLV